MHDVTRAPARLSPASPARCSVCAQRTDVIDVSPASARPGVTCGLCGAVIALRAKDVAPCHVCGQVIPSADGVKRCDGRIVQAVCGAHRR